MDTFWDWTYILLRLAVEFALTHPIWTAFLVLMVVVETNLDRLVRWCLPLYLLLVVSYLDYPEE